MMSKKNKKNKKDKKNRKSNTAYLSVALYRYIAGCRVYLGTIEDIFNGPPLDLVPFIDKFLMRLVDAIVAALLQATSVGDLGDIEVEVDVDGFDPTPLSFTAHNPAAGMGFSSTALKKGLSKAETKALISGIVFEAEDLTNNDIADRVYRFFVPRALKP